VHVQLEENAITNEPYSNIPFQMNEDKFDDA